MIRVPELDLVTQAESWDEVELTARGIIALELDLEVEDAQVELMDRA